MKQKCLGCSLDRVQPVSRYLVWMLLFIIFSVRPSYSTTDGYPQGKHDEKLETWAFHSKIDLPGKDGALYLGMFFCSGSLYFMKGNFAHIFWLDTSTGKYKYENNIFIPPLEKVTHSKKSLNEKYQDSFFHYNAIKNNIYTYASFDNFCTKLTLFPEKETFDYGHVRKRGPEESSYDWYMFPRMNIEASLDGGYDLCASGQGHFQHFWGDAVDESGDFIVAHLDSGYDVVINDIQPPADKDPVLLAEKYLLISEPTGQVQKISSFDYCVREWAESGKKGKKYPVHISVISAERELNLDIRVAKKDQTANLLGVEKWFGYAEVEGRIDNEPQEGWAFFSPIGKKIK